MKYEIVHRCGHKETVALFGKTAEREKRLDWMKSQPCFECRRAAQMAEDIKEQEEFGLPGLTGSEKQIAWAISLRAATYRKIEHNLERFLKTAESLKEDPDYSVRMQEYAELREAIEYTFSTKIESKFWIDNREKEYTPFLRELVAEYRGRIPEDVAEEIAQVEQKVAEECTIAPENPKEPGVATVTITDSAVSVEYVKSDSFRDVVKGASYSWNSDGGKWVRNLSLRTGNGVDRAAEIANKLLQAGFTVRLDNPDAREKAVAGTYEPETTRWIIAKPNHPGKVCITIPYGSNDLYQAARKLTGARWESGTGMIVPADSYQEIRDFAETMRYKISPGADEALEAAAATYEERVAKRTTITVPEKKEEQDGLAAKLENPGVIDDLRDTD